MAHVDETKTEPAFSPRDTKIIEEMFRAALNFFHEKDYAGWAALYAADGVFHPANGPARQRDELVAWAEEFPVAEMTWDNIQVWGDGNLAYGTTTYKLKLEDGTEDEGKQLAVVRRNASSSWGWEVVAASFNSDLPK